MPPITLRLQSLRNERGITGIETAIIMISFVVVASLFAYTVLSAGIFSAGKGKEAIHAGIDRAGSSMQLVGPIIAKDTNDDDDVDQIVFIVTNTLGTDGINFTPTSDADGDGLLSDETTLTHNTIVSYYDASQEITDLAWTTTQLGKGDNDAVLEETEKFEVTVDVNALSPRIEENDTFTMEVRLRNGATLLFERATGPVIDPINELE
jgi:flagellin FlaB